MDYGTVSTVCLASDNVLDLEKFSIEIFNFQYVVKQKPSNHSVQPQVTKTILWTNQYTFRKLNAHSQCKACENMLSLFTLVCFYFRLDNKVESFKLITWWSDAKLKQIVQSTFRLFWRSKGKSSSWIIFTVGIVSRLYQPPPGPHIGWVLVKMCRYIADIGQ